VQAPGGRRLSLTHFLHAGQVSTSLENAIEYQRQAFQADRPDDDGKKAI
jgi:hypothetical protein